MGTQNYHIDSFWMNPYRNLMELVNLTLKAVKRDAPIAYKCVAENLQSEIDMALSTPFESDAWRVFEARWVDYKMKTESPHPSEND